MKVSVLMAVYNGSKFVEQAIRSVMKQSHEDIELIICDDGSVDNTGDIIQKYESSKIKILTRAHKGKVSAFNDAFSVSSGDYICLLAHDDILTQESIEKRLRFTQANQASVTFCNARTFGVGIKSKILLNISKGSMYSWENELPAIIWDNLIGGGLIFFEKKLGDIIFPIPTNLVFEDWWITFNLLYLASKILYQDEVLFFYRLHDANDCGSSNSRHVDPQQQILRNWKRHLLYYDEFITFIKEYSEPSKKKHAIKLAKYCKELKLRSINKKITMPSHVFIKNIGIRKYITSQLIALRIYGIYIKIRVFLMKNLM